MKIIERNNFFSSSLVVRAHTINYGEVESVVRTSAPA